MISLVSLDTFKHFQPIVSGQKFKMYVDNCHLSPAAVSQVSLPGLSLHISYK